MFKKEYLRLYFIAGTQDFSDKKNPTSALYQCLEQALISGITCFQFREKGEKSLSDSREIFTVALQCRNLCAQYNVPFVVDDNLDLACKVQADGIHIGQKDNFLAVIETVQKEKLDLFIGLSVNTVEQALQAANLAVNYLGVGAIFTTTSKSDATQAKGVEFLLEIKSNINTKPIVAIGGINEENCQLVRATNCDGIAVISAISKSKDVQKTVRRLL
ncbi:MAG: thiamine phosphate synthase [Cardiobacteriaceae bacterium]|nr:thiamine phosphate synthase [Cardiobacteriaceae bacterium]